MRLGISARRNLVFPIQSLQGSVRREFNHSSIISNNNLNIDRSRNSKTRRPGTDKEDTVGDDTLGELNEEELLEEFLREGPVKGESDWRKSYTSTLNDIEKSITRALDTGLRANMHKIKTYNKSVNTTPLQRIKADLSQESKVANLVDFYPKNVLSNAIANYFGTDQLSHYQKKLFALSTSGISTVASGDQGSGKTMALITHSLLLKRKKARGEGISSLIIVRSNEMCLRYKQIISDIYSHMPSNVQNGMPLPQMAQFLYRSTEQGEKEQNGLLIEHQTPHILVTTAPRLLDLLATRGMDFVKIRNLPFIAVDDFDFIIGDSDNLLNKGKKAPPIVQLLDYVLKLQDYNRTHNEPHTQLIFTASPDAEIDLLENLREKEWFDWSRFVQMGSFLKFDELPTNKLIGDNIGISTVLVSPIVDEVNKRLKFELRDIEPYNYGDEIDLWKTKLFRSNGNDHRYFKHRNVKKTLKNKKVIEGELDCLLGGLNELLKKEYLGFGEKRVLLVHPDETSGRVIEEKLNKEGKRAKVLDVRHDLNFFSQSSPEGTSKDSTETILIASTSVLKGLCFKNLDTIICLGIDCMKSLSHFTTIAGRFRNERGLNSVQSSEFISTSEMQNEVDEDEEIPLPKNLLFLIQPQLDFEFLERNYLERLQILSGLMTQFESIGVLEEGFDAQSYEEEFSTSDFASEFLFQTRYNEYSH